MSERTDRADAVVGTTGVLIVAALIAVAMLIPQSVPDVRAFQFCGPNETYDDSVGGCVTFCGDGLRLDTATNECVPIGVEPSGESADPNVDGSGAEAGDDDFVTADGDRYDTTPDPAENEGVSCEEAFEPDGSGGCVAICDDGFRYEDGDCIEILNPGHPCVAAGRVPRGVTTNLELAGFAYLPGTGECVTQSEFARRLANFEASAIEEKEALILLTDISSQMLVLESELIGIQDQIEGARVDFSDATTAAWLAERSADDAAEDLEAVEAELSAERVLFDEQAVSAYMGGGDGELYATIGAADSAREFATATDYAESVLDHREQSIRRVEELEIRTADRRQGFEDAQAAAQEDADKAARLEATLIGILDEQERVLDRQNDKLNESAVVVSDIRAQKSEFAAALGTFDGASREIESILKEAELFSGRVSQFDGVFFPPVDPVDMASGFGPRLHPLLGYVRNHDGIDFSTGFGRPIFASAAGVVVIAGTMGGYGTTVVIDHGEGLGTLYAHQSAAVVDAGDEVTKGEIIGYIGSTGLSTGPHLHWEVRLNGEAVDPAAWIQSMLLE